MPTLDVARDRRRRLTSGVPEIRDFSAERTAIDGLWLISMKEVTDERGTVREFYRESAFLDAGMPSLGPWLQINVTETKPGALRGLHAEDMYKLVAVVAGEAFGAYVDARRDSATYGAVVTVTLTRGTQVLVPKGVGNAFQIVSHEPAQYVYCFDHEWVPGMAGTAVNPLDPALGHRLAAAHRPRRPGADLRQGQGAAAAGRRQLNVGSLRGSPLRRATPLPADQPVEVERDGAGAAGARVRVMVPSATSSDVPGRPSNADVHPVERPRSASLRRTLAVGPPSGGVGQPASVRRAGPPAARRPGAEQVEVALQDVGAASARGARRARRRGPPPASRPAAPHPQRAPDRHPHPGPLGQVDVRVGRVGRRGGGVHAAALSRPCVQTLAPPAPVLPSTPSTGPMPWSWKPAAKMSVAL